MTAATATTVQYLNLAYFGRPADPASLTGFPATGMTDEEIVLAFVKTSEYQTNTVTPNSTADTAGGRTFNVTNLINTFYQRLFGRLAASSEVNGWTTALNDGTVNYDYLGITIMRAGLNLPAGTAMRDVLLAKFASAQAFTDNLAANPTNAQAYSTSAAVQSGMSFLSAVTTSTAATAAEVTAAADGLVTTTVTGSSFTLTDKIDSFTGGAGSDTFVGDNGTTGAADNLDGGAGTDTLKLYGTTTMADFKNIENLSIFDATASSINLTEVGAGNVTKLTLDGYEAVAANTITVKQNDTIALIDGLDATNNTDDVNIAGGTGVTTVNIEVTDSGTSTTADMELDFTGTSMKTVNVKALGTEESFINIEAATTNVALTTVNITATSDLTITDIDDATTIDASASTGKVTLTTAIDETTITGGSGNDTVTLNPGDITYEGTVKLGAGDDVLILSADMDAATNLTDNKVTLDGGAGTDILEVDDDMAEALGDLSATNIAKKGISNFETLRINSDVPDDGDGDILLTNLQNFTTVEYEGAREDDHQLDDLVDNGTVKLVGADDDGDIHVTIKGASAAGRNSDTLNITLAGAHSAATTNFDYGAMQANNIENLNILSTTTKADALTLTTADNELDLVATAARNITITGTVDLDLDGDALEDAVEVIDASALTAELELSIVGANTAVKVTGSATEVNTITGSANADEIIGGAKADVFVTTGGNDVITLGGKSDTLSITSAATGGTALELVTIKDFKFGATADDGDVLKVDFDDIENQADGIGGIGTSDTVDGDGTSISAAASVIVGVSGATTMTGTGSVYRLSGANFADTDAVETALEAGGSHVLTTGGAIANDDGFFVVYTDGTDSYMALANNSSGGAVSSTTFASGDLEVSNFAKFQGVTNVTDLVAANITFI